MVKAAVLALLAILLTLPASAQAAHSVVLNWQPSADSGASYNVYRSLTSGAYTTPLNATPLSASALTCPSGTTGLCYTDATVLPGKYFYVVQPTENNCPAAFSNEISVSIAPAVVSTLKVLSAS
jgi:hypothetical protein